MTDRAIPDTWAEAANAADFALYELDRPVPRARWAGGYGWGDGKPVSLEILFAVGDDEVSIETVRERPPPPEDFTFRHLAMTMIMDSFHDGDAVLRLPRTWTLDSSDRTIVVDDTPVEFRGARLDGKWAGLAQLATGVTLRVKAAEGAVPDAIKQSESWAMSDQPPRDLLR